MTTIKSLANSFIQEATASPVLLNDLATMEMYIAESYTGRSLIELLQNADDAGSTRFMVRAIDNSTFIAANNGRIFSAEDLNSLCRSGASTKKRKSNTIGFRGIGFKAVVNYAKNVHVISGEYQFTFSRIRTAELLQRDIKVPLIRIPHEYKETQYAKYIDEIKKQGFATIFIFETVNNRLDQEIMEFSSDCLLFLNNVSEITFETPRGKQIIESKRSKNKYGTIHYLSRQNTKTEWLVVNSENKSAIAFKWDNGKIIPCSREEAVIHSFLPTQEYLGLPIKINGDFSTEPSRTRVSCDEETMLSISTCAEIIASLFKDILFSGNDEIGLVNVINNLRPDPLSKLRGLRANDLIIEEFAKAIRNVLNLFAEHNGKKDFIIQPKWLNDSDLTLIRKKSDCYIFGTNEEQAMSGIKLLLANMGVKELDIDSGLKVSKTEVFTPRTRTSLISAIANDTTLGISKERESLLKQAKLFESDKGVFSFEECSSDTCFSENFVDNMLANTEDSTKINFVLRKVGFSDEQVATVMAVKEPVETIKPPDKIFAKKIIKKWRSVEKNVAALLETLDGVAKVEDVSERNLGYDIRVWLKDGTERYYEVKSVSYLGDTISITNNEYSTASEYKDRYYLAIAKQSEDEITVCFVRNPINKLNLTKRVVRWEWIANSYDGEVVEGILKS